MTPKNSLARLGGTFILFAVFSLVACAVSAQSDYGGMTLFNNHPSVDATLWVDYQFNCSGPTHTQSGAAASGGWFSWQATCCRPANDNLGGGVIGGTPFEIPLDECGLDPQHSGTMTGIASNGDDFTISWTSWMQGYGRQWVFTIE